MLKTVIKLLITMAALSVSLGVNAKWFSYNYTDDFNDEIVTYTKYTSGKSVIKVQCVNNNDNYEFDVYLTNGKYLGTDSRSVSWRFDKNKIIVGYALGAIKGTGLFITDSYNKDLAFSLTKHNKVQFQFKDFRGTTYTVKFNLNGSMKAINPVLAACNISLLGES